jgi:hypothetical protein
MDIVFYLRGDDVAAVVVDVHNQKVAKPTITRGLLPTLKIRPIHNNGVPFTLAELNYAAWDFVFDNDWNTTTTPKIRVQTGITVTAVTINIDEEDVEYAEIQISITDTNTLELIAALNNGASTSLGVELAGMAAGVTNPGLVWQWDMTVRNRRGTAGTGTPTHVGDGTYSSSQVDALVRAGREVQFSVDGENAWHDIQDDADLYLRERFPGGAWSVAIKMPRGPQGIQGLQGPQGEQGLQGIQGIQGIQGVKGDTGTSVILKGSVDTFDDLPDSAQAAGDLYVVLADGHGYAWSGTAWEDCGLMRGPQGEQGIQGTQGIQGVKGDAGAQGAQGIQGVQGPQGEQGIQGTQGVQGSKGDKGDKGDAGTSVQLRGSVAIVADLPSSGQTIGDLYVVLADGDGYVWSGTAWTDVGPIRGPAGEQGEQGEQGVQGIQGIQGATGATGAAGAQGIQGPKGDTGAQGPQGDQGIQGVKGDTGAQGIQGEKGDKGDTGAQGPQGIQGDKGDKGDTGAQGAQGIQGIQGPQGPQGIQGDKGDKGDKGDPGEGGGTSIETLLFRVPAMADDSALHFALEVFSTVDYSGAAVESFNSAVAQTYLKIFDGSAWIAFPAEGAGNPYYENKLSVALQSVESETQYYIRYKWFIKDSTPANTPWEYSQYPALETNSPDDEISITSTSKTLNTYPGDHIIDSEDLGAIIRTNSTTANKIIIPTNSAYTSSYPLAHNDTYVKSTTHSQTEISSFAYYATDPSKSLTHYDATNSWRSNNGADAHNNRFHIDLGMLVIIERVYYENYSFGDAFPDGGNEHYGVRNFTLWGSNSETAFNDLVYGHDTGWVQLTCAQNVFDQHAATNLPDPKYILVTNSTAYRYYAFKFADTYNYQNYPDINAHAGLRRVELQRNVIDSLPANSLFPVLQSGSGVTSIKASDGVTLNGVSGGLCEITARYRKIELLKISANEWEEITGNIGNIT